MHDCIGYIHPAKENPAICEAFRLKYMRKRRVNWAITFIVLKKRRSWLGAFSLCLVCSYSTYAETQSMVCNIHMQIVPHTTLIRWIHKDVAVYLIVGNNQFPSLPSSNTCWLCRFLVTYNNGNERWCLSQLMLILKAFSQFSQISPGVGNEYRSRLRKAKISWGGMGGCESVFQE